MEALDQVAVAPLARAGDIVGRVLTGTSGNSLPGAQITLVDTGESAVSDSEGRFLMSNVAAGSATLRIEYSGHEPKTQKVSVPASG